MSGVRKGDMLGKVPGKAFADTHEPYNTIRVGIITRVDPHNMKCDVKVLTGTERKELDLTQPMCGPRSFLGGIPEVNSLVLIGYRRKHKNQYEAVIVGYVPVGLSSGLRFDPFSGINPADLTSEERTNAEKLYGSTIRYKRIKGQPGDIMGMSAAGAELLLSRDVRLFNRAGDLFELRDVDRTMVSQAIHQVHSDSGSYFFSGAIRRGMMNLPRDIFQKGKDGNRTGIVKGTTEGYYGRDELATTGVAPNTFINPATFEKLERINDDTEFPPTTFASGRQVYYASVRPAEGITELGSDSNVFVERRLEMRHTTDLQQSVLDEIDGFTASINGTYIEHAMGTLVGNNPFGSEGMRQYGRVLKPKIFDDFDSRNSDKFRLDDCIRTPGNENGDEAQTMAGAFLFRMSPPDPAAPNNPFVAAISKQGKLFLNVPGSRVENYDAKNISAEVNMTGALKVRLGAAKPDNISLHLVCEGGVHVEFGADSDGRSITYAYRGTVKNEYKGTNDTDGVAHSDAVQGNAEKAISGNYTKSVQGAVDQKVSGGYSLQATKIALNGLSSVTATAGEWNLQVNGKSQLQYALAIIETIIAGGRVSTILAGGEIKNIVAGGAVTNIVAGGEVHNITAGGFITNVTAGAISLSTQAGAVSLLTAAGAIGISAAAGAVAITAGLACNITATVISLISPQILLGGPPAVLGVSRGLPIMPPGVPSLCWITGLPLMGCAVVRSI